MDDVELENGAKAKRELVMHPGGVCVAALTDQDEMLFVRQFRYPYREVVLEAPAGKLERGEDPFEACKREQREETGTTADTYLNLGSAFTLRPVTATRSYISMLAASQGMGNPTWMR